MEEPPTDYDYDRLSEDLRSRHPQADTHLIDHVVSLEAFLDKSILFGFSFGINNAEVAVAEGKLLGHKIGQNLNFMRQPFDPPKNVPHAALGCLVGTGLVSSQKPTDKLKVGS